MRFQLGSFIDKVPVSDWSVTVESGGNLSGGAINLHLSLVNRVGFNLLSIPVNAVYSAGDKLTIVLNPSIIRDGEDIHKFVISGQTTGNNSDAVQLAEISYREEFDTGNFTLATLPLTLELTEDSHLETANLAIADFSNFPAIPVNGMLRELGGQWYRYDVDATEGAYPATIGYWIAHYFSTASTYLTSTQSDRGADRSQGAAIIAPPKKKIGNNDSLKVRYWGNNDDLAGEIIKTGTALQLLVSVNGNLFSNSAPDGYGSKFSNLIKYQLVGYYRTSDSSFNSSVTDAGTINLWSINNPIVIPEDLTPGYIAVYDIWLSYTESQIAGKGISENDVIGIGLKLGLDAVGSSSLAAIYGNNLILNRQQCLTIVPNKMLSGYGIVNGLDFQVSDFLPLAGMQQDTANQLVLIAPDTKSVRVGLTATTGEVVRATISTEGGYGQPSPVSNSIALIAGQNLEITFSHPVAGGKATIRGDYPDSQTAGNNQADWNSPDIRLFVKEGGQWYQKTNLIAATAFATQTITLTDLADFSPVPGIPDGIPIYGADFGLYAAGQPTIVATGTGGSLTAGTYEAIWYYEYPLPNAKITKIDHVANNAIAKEETTQSKVYQDTLTLAAAKALTINDLSADLLYAVKNNNTQNLYYWDATSVLAGDDYTVVEVAGIASGRLRLVGTPKPNYSNGTNSYSQPTLEFGSSFTVTEDAPNNKIAIAFDTTLLVPNPNQWQVADLTALKAIDVTSIANNSYQTVLSVADTNYQFAYALYYWDATATFTPIEPTVIKPDSVTLPDPGRWISLLPMVATVAPTNAPEFSNQEYWAVLTAPDRLVKWRSPIILPTTPTVNDWISDYTPIAIATTPTFNSDFPGQVVVAIDTGIRYKDTDGAGTWVAL